MVVGRSDIVGKPMALLLLHQNATVTICHSKTSNLADECRRADILVAAIGKAASDHARIHQARRGGDRRRHESRARTAKAGRATWTPTAAKALASAYTPVPGGVGPLTIAMLMANTVEAAEQHLCCG